MTDKIKEFNKELAALCEKYNVEQYVDYCKYACEDVICVREICPHEDVVE